MNYLYIVIIILNGLSSIIAITWYQDLAKTPWNRPFIFMSQNGTRVLDFLAILSTPWIVTILSFLLIKWYLAIILYIIVGLVGGYFVGIVLDKIKLMKNAFTFIFSSLLAISSTLLICFFVWCKLQAKN